MAEPTQQGVEGSENAVQFSANTVQQAPGVVTQVHSETTTYATDGDRFVERHEVLAGPLGEEEGYVEKREGHLGAPSGGLVEEVEDGREVGLLEPVEDEAMEEVVTEANGKKLETAGLQVPVEEGRDVVGEDTGEGTKEPPHTEAGTPDETVAEEAGETTTQAAAADKQEETQETQSTDETGAADDVSLIDADRKRKADAEHEGTAEDAKKHKGADGEAKRGRGRPAKGETNGEGKGGKQRKEAVEGTRRSTRTKGKA